MATKNQGADTSVQSSEEQKQPEAIKQAHEELQKAIHELQANERLLQPLDEWLMDESGYDEATWPKLKAALEQDHSSARSLFDE